MRARAMAMAVTMVAAAAVAAAPPAAARDNEDAYGTTLRTGHCLVANKHNYSTELTSPSGRFSFDVFPAQLDIYEHVDPRGVGGMGNDPWMVVVNLGRSRYGRLCMQTDGNLVFRYGKHRAYGWSSHTDGTGRHNYAQLLDAGRLVVRTASGRTVWSTGTTATMMIWKDRLDSGAELRNIGDRHRRTHLEMRRSGELVLTENKHVRWRSHTHVRGSYLVVTSTGRAQIRTPSGRAVWSSRAVGRAAVLYVATRGRFMMTSVSEHRGCWVRPRHTGDCGTG